MKHACKDKELLDRIRTLECEVALLKHREGFDGSLYWDLSRRIAELEEKTK